MSRHLFRHLFREHVTLPWGSGAPTAPSLLTTAAAEMIERLDAVAYPSGRVYHTLPAESLPYWRARLCDQPLAAERMGS